MSPGEPRPGGAADRAKELDGLRPGRVPPRWGGVAAHEGEHWASGLWGKVGGAPGRSSFVQRCLCQHSATKTKQTTDSADCQVLGQIELEIMGQVGMFFFFSLSLFHVCLFNVYLKLNKKVTVANISKYNILGSHDVHLKPLTSVFWPDNSWSEGNEVLRRRRRSAPPLF